VPEAISTDAMVFHVSKYLTLYIHLQSWWTQTKLGNFGKQIRNIWKVLKC